MKKRLDILLHESGLVATRAQATMIIKKSGVYCDNVIQNKPGVKFDENVSLRLVEAELYVSRGAYKLIAALDEFQLNPKSLVCADIGASTGGFTEVLLQRGASRVYALDVGHDQLAQSLRDDERVINLEGVNAKYPIELPEKVDLIVSDLSHISMLKVLPEALKILKNPSKVIWLIKPQFEAGRERIGKGGIVDIKFHLEILKEVIEGINSFGAVNLKMIDSPILGKKGNKEYLAYFEMALPTS